MSCKRVMDSPKDISANGKRASSSSMTGSQVFKISAEAAEQPNPNELFDLECMGTWKPTCIPGITTPSSRKRPMFSFY